MRYAKISGWTPSIPKNVWDPKYSPFNQAFLFDKFLKHWFLNPRVLIFVMNVIFNICRVSVSLEIPENAIFYVNAIYNSVFCALEIFQSMIFDLISVIRLDNMNIRLYFFKKFLENGWKSSLILWKISLRTPSILQFFCGIYHSTFTRGFFI